MKLSRALFGVFFLSILISLRINSQTPCATLEEIPIEIKESVEDAFTLYRDQMRFGLLKDALPLWRHAYYNAPGSNGNVTYHFDDGIKIFDDLFKKATDTEIKRAYVDTILSIYDKRVECFGDDGTIAARKAFNSYYYYSQFTDKEETYNLFKRVVDLKKEKADYFVINPFSKMVYDRVLDSLISIDEAQEYVAQIFEAIAYGTANATARYKEAWEAIGAYAPPLLAGLEGIRGFYDCQYYLDKYTPQYLEDSTTCDNVTEVYLKTIWAYCDTANPLIVRIKKQKDTICYVPPPPPGPLRLAKNALEAGDFDMAIEYYQEYINNTDDPEKKADKLLRIAKIYYAHKVNFPMARKFALMAAEQKANWGDPFILIGKLYASSGPLCGPGRGWDSQIVTWPAIDKFEHAKRIDENVIAEANRFITRYSQYMPSSEDIFMRPNVQERQRFKVGCWIQEYTRVRAAP